jgi:hypothetical protein
MPHPIRSVEELRGDAFGTALPSPGLAPAGSPPHPQRAEDKRAEQHDNADEQQVQRRRHVPMSLPGWEPQARSSGSAALWRGRPGRARGRPADPAVRDRVVIGFTISQTGWSWRSWPAPAPTSQMHYLPAQLQVASPGTAISCRLNRPQQPVCGASLSGAGLRNHRCPGAAGKRERFGSRPATPRGMAGRTWQRW